METVVDWLSWLSFTGGAFFLFTGAFGLLRFPDFYTRMHAAGTIDTLGAGLMLFGMILQSADMASDPWWVTTIKLVLIGVFIFFTSPTSTYAIANAAYSQGLKPLLMTKQSEGDGSSKT